MWEDEREVNRILKEYSELKKEVEEIEGLEKRLEKIKKEEVEGFEEELRNVEFKYLLSGKYDASNAILQIIAGTGGKDAQDFAAILKEMYEKYLRKKGFKTKLIDINYGEGVGPEGRAGIKSCLMEVEGKYAFGILKKESGVHRLVRISPFSPKGLRHTSFVLVEVFPKLEKSEIKVNPQDLEIEFFKASGRGGQYVNKRMSAVRIRHLPTGIEVVCQSERSQIQNKEKAMEILLSKLSSLQEEEKRKEILEIRGKRISPSWGNQIRSYIFDPYQLVKDYRTKIEDRDVESVLNGNLDKFIFAEIYLK